MYAKFPIFVTFSFLSNLTFSSNAPVYKGRLLTSPLEFSPNLRQIFAIFAVECISGHKCLSWRWKFHSKYIIKQVWFTPFSLACRCAERALQKGYNYFGLQFYGECWSGPFAEFNYSRAGVSDKCIMNLKKPTACVQAQDQECVGQQLTNYIYKLTSSKNHQWVRDQNVW